MQRERDAAIDVTVGHEIHQAQRGKVPTIPAQPASGVTHVS